MFHRTLCLLSFLMAALWLQAASAQADPVKVIVLGDDLSSGYQLPPNQAFPKVLEQYMRSQSYDLQVIDMSVAGTTSGEAYARINDVLAQKPDIVVVQLGANDALRNLDPIAQTYNNLHSILYILTKSNIHPILVGVNPPSTMTRRNAQQFLQQYAMLAKNYKVHFYPNFMEGVQGVREYLLADGTHPNYDGVRVMVESFAPTLAQIAYYKQREKKAEAEKRSSATTTYNPTPDPTKVIPSISGR